MLLGYGYTTSRLSAGDLFDDVLEANTRRLRVPEAQTTVSRATSMEEHGPGLVANGGAYCSAALGRGVGNGGAYCSAADTVDLCDVEDVSGGAYCSATLHGVHGDRTTAYCSGDAAAYCSGVGRAIPANNMVVSGGAIGAAHAASGANPVVASSTGSASSPVQ